MYVYIKYKDGFFYYFEITWARKMCDRIHTDKCLMRVSSAVSSTYEWLVLKGYRRRHIEFIA